MTSVEKISDFDQRVVYLPNDPAPSSCATSPDNERCASKWWATDEDTISLHTTWGPDTSFEFTFTGEAVELWGSTSGSGAVGRASIDNGPEVVVNFASADGQYHLNQILMTEKTLAPGQHTLQLRYNNASFGKAGNRKFIFIDFFQIYSTTTTSILSSTSGPSSSAPADLMPTTVTVPGGVVVSYVTPPPQSSSGQFPSRDHDDNSGPHLSIILPAAIVGALVFLALGAVLALWWSRRRRRRRRVPVSQGVSPYAVPAFADSGSTETSPFTHWVPSSSERERPPPAYSPAVSTYDESMKVVI